MTAMELTTFIGEQLELELPDLNRVTYRDCDLTSFVAVMENGKRFTVTITEEKPLMHT